MFFEAEANSSLNLADGDQVRRPPSFAASEVRYTNDRNVGPMRIVGQSFSRINSFVNSENIESLQEEITFQYGVSSTFSIPFYKRRNTLVHKLSPKLMLSYNGQEGRTKGDYFSGGDQLSFGNIYARKKLVSLSESELGFSVSSGFDYSINSSDGRALDFWFGGLWLEDSTKAQNQNAQLQPKTLNYVGGFNYQNNKAFVVNGDTILDKKGEILKVNLSGKTEVKDFNLASHYEFIDAEIDEGINENLENINLSFSYSGFEHFGVSAFRRYDLSKNAMSSSKASLNMNFSTGFWNYQFSQTFDATSLKKQRYRQLITMTAQGLQFLCKIIADQEVLRIAFNLWPFWFNLNPLQVSKFLASKKIDRRKQNYLSSNRSILFKNFTITYIPN